MDIHQTDINVGSNPMLLMINHECHIILGGSSRFHYKWNSELKLLEKVHKFGQVLALEGHGVIHIKSQNRLLLFGGFDEISEESLEGIWECDLNDTLIWRKLENIELPTEMESFAWVLSKCENYLVIFGGMNDYGVILRNIFECEFPTHLSL